MNSILEMARYLRQMITSLKNSLGKDCALIGWWKAQPNCQIYKSGLIAVIGGPGIINYEYSVKSEKRFSI